MIATLLSFLVVFYLGSTDLGLTLLGRDAPWADAWAIGTLLTSGVIFAVAAFSQALLYIPLQRAEIATSPQVFTMWRESKQVRIAWAVFSAAPIFIFLLLVLARLWDRPLISLGALPLIGFSFDAMLMLFIEARKLLNPYSLIYLFTNRAKAAWKRADDQDVLRWFDALEETGQRALDNGSTALCRSTCQQLFKLLSHFVEIAPRLGLEAQGSEESEKNRERLLYLFSAFFQHLDALNEKALITGQYTICHDLISLLGKTSIILAQRNLELAAMPLVHIGSIADSALEQDDVEVAEKATAALMAVGKTVPNVVDLEKVDLYPYMCALIDHLDAIAKAMFKRDKETPIAQLTRPFNELSLVFKDDELSARSDSERIEERIGRVLEEFAALELVLYKLPIKEPEEGVVQVEEEEEDEEEGDEDL